MVVGKIILAIAVFCVYSAARTDKKDGFSTGLGFVIFMCLCPLLVPIFLLDKSQKKKRGGKTRMEIRL